MEYTLAMLMTLLLLGIIFVTIYCACKHIEVEHPMEIIVARRIERLKVLKTKKECKIDILKFYKNKNNSDYYTTKIQTLRLEIMIIEREMSKLINYGKI